MTLSEITPCLKTAMKSRNGKKVMRMDSPTTGRGFGLLFEMGCG